MSRLSKNIAKCDSFNLVDHRHDLYHPSSRFETPQPLDRVFPLYLSLSLLPCRQHTRNNTALDTQTLVMSNATCYWPNGNQIPPSAKYSPCLPNPISGRDQSHFACCDDAAICTDQGLCVGSANWFYRGGCTDKSWASSSCASACVAKTTNDTFDQGGFVNLVVCGNGTRSAEWCCESAGGGGSSCCAAASNMLLGRPYAFVPNSTASTSSSTSSATTSGTLASSTMSSSTAGTATGAAASGSSGHSQALSSGSDSTKIGLGVGLGLGLGLLLIALLSFFIFRERKRRVQAEKRMEAMVSHPTMEVAQPKMDMQRPPLNIPPSQDELPAYNRPQEVPASNGSQRYEVQG